MLFRQALAQALSENVYGALPGCILEEERTKEKRYERKDAARYAARPAR